MLVGLVAQLEARPLGMQVTEINPVVHSRDFVVKIFLRLFFLFCCFKKIIFCFVVAICDLVHDVETILHLSCVLTASGNLF